MPSENLPPSQVENIPLELREVARWHGFKLMLANDPAKKARKVPVGINGQPIDATNTSNWASYGAALVAKLAGVFDYLGFALGPDGSGNCWQGIDLDNIAENGLQWLADNLPGYVEWSQSGKGVHAIGYGKPFRVFKHGGVEAYCEKRSFVVTGNVIRGAL